MAGRLNNVFARAISKQRGLVTRPKSGSGRCAEGRRAVQHDD
jgi:hypothetical protein